MSHDDAVALFSFEGVGVEAPDGTQVLADVDLVLPEDRTTVVVGPSGAGKSTLLRLCNRLGVPTSGTVRFRGTPLQDLDPREHRRRVGMVFQRPVTFAGTVGDNLAAADFLIHAIRGVREGGGSFHIVALFPPLLETLRRFHVLEELGAENLHISKGDALAAILTQIDYSICATCAKRVFLECADLPGAENPATEVARA